MTTDRFVRELKTDTFGFGLFGSVFRFNRTNPSIWSAGRRRCKSCPLSRLGVASLPAAAPWPVLGAAWPAPRPLLAGRRYSSLDATTARRRRLVDSPLPARLRADLLRSSLISLEVAPVPLLAPAATAAAVQLLSLLAAPLASSGARSRHSLAPAQGARSGCTPASAQGTRSRCSACAARCSTRALAARRRVTPSRPCRSPLAWPSRRRRSLPVGFGASSLLAARPLRLGVCLVVSSRVGRWGRGRSSGLVEAVEWPSGPVNWAGVLWREERKFDECRSVARFYGFVSRTNRTPSR